MFVFAVGVPAGADQRYIAELGNQDGLVRVLRSQPGQVFPPGRGAGFRVELGAAVQVRVREAGVVVDADEKIITIYKKQ